MTNSWSLIAKLERRNVTLARTRTWTGTEPSSHSQYVIPPISFNLRFDFACHSSESKGGKKHHEKLLIPLQTLNITRLQTIQELPIEATIGRKQSALKILEWVFLRDYGSPWKYVLEGIQTGRILLPCHWLGSHWTCCISLPLLIVLLLSLTVDSLCSLLEC